MIERWAAFLFAAYWLSGCAQVEHRQQLAEPVGHEITVPVGGTLATINKQKDLPNVFGRADLYGRQVDTGFTKIVFKGRSPEGGAILEQLDVDIQSNASVFTRMPSIYSASSQASVTGTGGFISGSGTGSAVAMSPQPEQNIVLPPTEATFVVPKGKTLTLPTGQTLEFMSIEPYQITYRIKDKIINNIIKILYIFQNILT